MTVTVEVLRKFVNASETDDEYVGECLEVADALVTQRIGSAEVPVAIADRAVLECASELFHRRNSPSGVMSQFVGPDGGAAPFRLARDPMTAATEVLKPFLLGGFA